MKPKLSLSIQNASVADALPTRAQIRQWAEAALQPGIAKAEITFRIVDAEEGLALNRDYRGKDYATNVLTFTFDDEMPAIPGLPLLGDIVLCAPVVAREAAEQGKRPRDHWAHLPIHGVLHLLGHDHETAAEANRMEALEIRILAPRDISDPYA